jgi:uncharacterized protein YhaN
VRIVEINTSGFGQFNGAHLKPAPGLTVIRGPNEAGKTTFLAFIRAMLFGFERDKYPALNGGRRGGWLTVEMADGRRFRIERYGERGGSGKLSVQDEAHTELGEGTLATLLQGVESGVYRNIFAFGLGELTQFGSLTDAEVAARIYGAGLGTGSISGLDVEGALRGEMEALFKPGGQLPRINALLRELEELDAQLKDRDLPAVYAAAGARLADVDRQLEELGRTIADTSALRRARQRVIDGWPAWLELRAARADRAALGETRVFAPDALERLSRLETSLAATDESVRDATAARDQAAQKVDAAVLDEAALARRQELTDLAEASRTEAARTDERVRTDQELAGARANMDAAVARIGTGWTVERVEAFDDSVGVHADISGPLRSMLARAAEAEATARRDLKATEDRLAELTGQVETSTARATELESELAERPPLPTREQALQRVRTLTERLDEVRRIAEDLPDGDLVAERDGLEQRGRDARDLRAALETVATTSGLLSSATLTAEATAARPWEPYVLPAVVAIAGVVVAVALLLANAPLLSVGLVAIGALALAAVLAWMRRPRSIADAERVRGQLQEQLDEAASAIGRLGPALELGSNPGTTDVERLLVTLDDERRTLEQEEARRDRAMAATQEVERLGAEIATIAEGVGLPSAPDAAQVQAFAEVLDTDRAAAGRLSGLREQVSALQATLVTVTTRRDELVAAVGEREAESGSARVTWQDWLRGHDLEPTYDQETAARVIDAVSAAKVAVAAMRGLEARHAAQVAEREAFVAVVASLADLLPPGVAAEADPDGAALLLGQRLATALEDERTRAGLARALAEREERWTLAEQARTAAGDSLAAFLEELGAVNPDGLRTEVSRSERGASLEATAEARTATLTALSGPGEALAAFQADLEAVTDIAEVHGEVEGLDGQLGDRAVERDTLNQEAGALRRSREEMEADAAATELRQRRADVQAQIEAAAERWTVLALARDLLRRSRHAYEEAHRPAVVTAAERHFGPWTDGRYPRIMAPLGQPIDGVERADGQQLTLAALSRGTSEQLYLALRFGLVEHFVETSGEPLPIVMDDILVNFDDDRAARAARSIEELAQTCQVIYFTCHPTTPLKAHKEETMRLLEVGT